MKKLIELVKRGIKQTPMKYKSFWVLAIALATTLIFYDQHQLGKENYRLLPKKESRILQKYDGGIKGWYHMEDIRKLLIDYDLVARETPREIPELNTYGKKIEDPNNLNHSNILK